MCETLCVIQAPPGIHIHGAVSVVLYFRFESYQIPGVRQGVPFV